MRKCVWYISKYVATKSDLNSGGRAYHLMSEIVNLGHTSLIITSDSNNLTDVPKLNNTYHKDICQGVLIIWIRTLKYRTAKSFSRILSWIDFELKLFLMPKKTLPKPDALIVSSLSILTIINGFILRSRFKCKLVFEIRDIWPLTIIEEGGYKKSNLFVRFLSIIEKIGYKYSDIIVGTMPNLKEHVFNILGYDKTVFCIPMGINSEEVDNSTSVTEEYLETYLLKGKFIIAHAGTIGITNALDTFFECCRLMKEYHDIHFMIIGDGDLLLNYKRNYSNLDNLTFAPKIPKQMVHSVLEKCDLLYFSVFKSKVWQYGQSLNKVIDYMASGKPVVASYSGFPSMINEAGCGSFVEANNVNALKNEILKYSKMTKKELATLGSNGREWILANRNYRKLAKEYLSILEFEESSYKELTI